jgi:hypothetical protein
MSISKYFGTPADPQGAPLYWSDMETFPFRGPPPTMLKGEEIEQIPQVYDAKAIILTLPDDIDRYQDIIDHCANGAWYLRHEKLEFDPTTKKYTAFLSWLEIYRQTPASKTGWEVMRNAYRRSEME